MTALPFLSGKRVSDSKNASDFGIEGSSTVCGISTEAVSSEEETTSIAFGSEDVCPEDVFPEDVFPDSTQAVSREEETTPITFGSEEVSGVITLTLILE